VSRGREVSLFCVLDTNIEKPAFGPSAKAAVGRYARAFVRLAQGQHSFRDRIYQVTASFVARCRHKPLLRRVGPLIDKWTEGSTRFMLNKELTEAFQLRAFQRWVRYADKPPLPGKVTVFRSQEDRPGVSREMGWDHLFASVDLIPVAGDHREMLRAPFRTDLCKRFSAAIGSTSAT
jgi:thioesterase domain-containing protein